jgi:hypothetical protein
MTTAPKLTLPSRSLLDGMPYENSVSTDIRALFARVKAKAQKKRKHDSVPKGTT